MIVAKCPLRISLVGGSTDSQLFIDTFGKGSVISFTPNLYTYISIKPNRNPLYRINYSTVENLTDPTKIKNDIAREVIKYFKLPPLTMTFNADIPSSGSGLASSSSYMIAAIQASLKFLNKDWSQFKICTLALKLERKFNPLTGYQDPYGCGIGGLKKYDFLGGENIDIKFLNLKFSNFFMSLIPTQINRNSTKILKSVDINKCIPLLEDVNSMEKANNIKDICFIINKAWEKKKTLSNLITNKDILKLENQLRLNKDILAIKLLGAGGGGYFLSISKKLLNINNSIPINIDNKGVIVWGV